jgi:choline kinase
MTVGIILAAGSGRRLKIHKPKGLLNIGGKPLIDYSLDNLRDAGVYNVILVTGFASDAYENYFTEHYQGDTKVTLVHNPEWQACGSLYSLYIGLQNIKDKQDVVILDSDILYNRDEFLDFMQRPERDAVLATNVPEGRHDACFIQEDFGGNLLKVSKNLNTLGLKDTDELWEYIGITQSSWESLPMLRRYAREKFDDTGSIDHEYDYAFESINRKYKVIRYRDYIWSEADDNAQLQHMITNTYPKISLF